MGNSQDEDGVSRHVRRRLHQWAQSMNDGQRQAFLYENGKMLVLAGAGTGKTRVLTHLIARLILLKKVKPWEVLALTFTRKAAGEMQQRMQSLLDGKHPTPDWIKTFHASILALARRTPEMKELLGIPVAGEIKLIDPSDGIGRQYLEQAMLEAGLAITGKPNAPDPVQLCGSGIAALKGWGAMPQDAESTAHDQISRLVDQGFAPPSGVEEAVKAYAGYQRRLQAAGVIDFGDLILGAVRLLQQQPRVAQRWREKFKYVLVDEFQDTTMVQMQFLRLMVQGHDNLVCVGDEDQMIYGWNQAEAQNILDFAQEPGVNVVRITEHYRCTPTILKTATDIIAHNAIRLGKILTPAGHEPEPGHPVTIHRTDNEKSQADYVVDLITKLTKSEFGYSDIAIQIRTNAMAGSLETALVANGIPYTRVGGSFEDKPVVRDVLAYCQAVLDPMDVTGWCRIANRPPRGIGELTIQKIKETAELKRCGARQATLQYLAEHPKLRRDIAHGLKSLQDLIAEYEPILSELLDDDRGSVLSGADRDGAKYTISQVVNRLLAATGYRSWILDADPGTEYEADSQATAKSGDGADVWIDRLLALADDHPEQFKALLGRDGSVIDDDVERNNVTLLTIHAAKGLEWPVVILPGWAEGSMPVDRAVRDGRLEEERNLAYVAITRGEKQVYIVVPRWIDDRQSYDSRFLSEIAAETPIINSGLPPKPARHHAPTQAALQHAEMLGRQLDRSVPDLVRKDPDRLAVWTSFQERLLQKQQKNDAEKGTVSGAAVTPGTISALGSSVIDPDQACTLVAHDILRAVQNADGNWQMPWHGCSGLPIHCFTRRPYRGSNVLILWAAARTAGYTNHQWASEQAWHAHGVTLRSNAVGTEILQPVYRGKSEQALQGFTRHRIFNLQETECETERDASRQTTPLNAVQAVIDLCEKWREGKGSNKGPALIDDPGICAFDADTDCIKMAPLAAFRSKHPGMLAEQHYAAILLHEHIHATGSMMRLRRPSLLGYQDNLAAQVEEELIAELGAAIAGAKLELSTSLREDHGRYVRAWMALLQTEIPERMQVFFRAFRQAEYAVDYLFRVTQ